MTTGPRNVGQQGSPTVREIVQAAVPAGITVPPAAQALPPDDPPPRRDDGEATPATTQRGLRPPNARLAEMFPLFSIRAPDIVANPVELSGRDRANLAYSGTRRDPTVGAETANTFLRLMNLAGIQVPVGGRLTTPEVQAAITRFRREHPSAGRGTGTGTTIDNALIDTLVERVRANPPPPIRFVGFENASEAQRNAGHVLAEIGTGDPLRFARLRERLGLGSSASITTEDADKLARFISAGRDGMPGLPMTNAITTLLNHGQRATPGAWDFEMARGLVDFMLDRESQGRSLDRDVLWGRSMVRAADGYLPPHILRAVVAVESDARPLPPNAFGAEGWAQLTREAAAEYRIMPDNSVVYVHGRSTPRGAREANIANVDDHLRVSAFHLTRLYDEAAASIGLSIARRPEDRNDGRVWSIAHSGYNSGVNRIGPYAGIFPSRPRGPTTRSDPYRAGETQNHVDRVRYLTAVFMLQARDRRR